MNIEEFISSLPNIAELSNRSRFLLVAYHFRKEGKTTFSVTELATSLTAASLLAPPTLQKSLDLLTKGARPPVLSIPPDTYGLSIDGVREIEDYLDSVVGIRPARDSLVTLVGKLTAAEEKQFLAEVIACVQVNAKRSAVVMCWLLTVAHLENYVLAHKLAEFNTALAARPDYKGVLIITKDDFSLVKKESHFIEILKSANVITNDVRKILDVGLGFRNSCAHPSTVEIPETKVIASIEEWVLNIILKYQI